jgi:hypothetical protein
MYKAKLPIMASILSFLLSCGGSAPTSVVIQNPLTPLPDILLYKNTASAIEDLTTQMTGPINRTIAQGESACVFSLFGSSGTYNVGIIQPQPPSGNGLPTTINYTINSANTLPIPFSYTGSTGVYFSTGTLATDKKDYTMTFLGHTINSWGNLPPTGPFAGTTLPTPAIRNSFTIQNNINNGMAIRYIDRVGVNVSGGNLISILLKTWDLPNTSCLGLATASPYTIAEVQIAYQKFGTPMSPYQVVPSSLVQATTAGELTSTITLPQPTVPYLNRARPAPGIYYIRMFLTDASRRYTVVSEISPAFVVWDL